MSSNAAMDDARETTRISGGYGFMNELPAGRFHRDAEILEIGEGTGEERRMIIADARGREPAGPQAASWASSR